MKEVLHDIAARDRELAAETQRREMSLRSGVPDDTERLLMLHVLNESLAVLHQLVASEETRPFAAYLELCRLAGRLAVFSADRGVMEYPVYDHHKLGDSFRLVCEHIRALLRPFGAGTVKWRDFQPRESGKGMQVLLEEGWLTDDCEMFVGVHCATMDPVELDRTLKGIEWKIASLDDVDVRFAGGLPGLDLRAVRLPAGVLPAGAEIKYYEIVRDAELWPRVMTSRTLAMRYTPEGQAKLEGILFRIYLVNRGQTT
jgi:type VI secretion system protein ImpJ